MNFLLPAALATTVVLAGCQDDSAGPEEDASVEDVAEADPDEEEDVAEEDVTEEAAEEEAGTDLLGQDVTVSGEITEVVADGAFWLGGEYDVFGEGGAPVVSASGDFTDMGIEDPQGLVDADTIVQVQGTVQEFVLVDLEDEWGIDLEDSAYEELEGEAVIVADQVQTLAGEDVTTTGEVDELLSTVAFRLVGAGWSVVVLDAQQAAVEPGEAVEVTGTVRQMDIAEIEQDYGMDLDDELYAAYEGQLVLVADQVSPAGAATTE